MVVIDPQGRLALLQNAGNLGIGEPVVVAEVEDQPLAERQIQHRLLEPHQSLLGRIAALLRHPVGQFAAHIVERGEEAAPPTAQQRKGRTGGNAVEPDPQLGRPAPKGVQGIIGLDEALLHDILGILVDDDQPAHVPVQRPEPGPDNRIERLAPDRRIVQSGQKPIRYLPTFRHAFRI